jgi:LysR family transcriptional regulator, regulator for genes of the gallate degradation pathway
MPHLSNNLSVSFRRLRAFEAAAQHQSLSAAAQFLRLSQSALTQSLNHFEAQLGVKLLDRGLEGSFLTPAGQAFHRRTQRFFAQMEDAIAHMRGLSAQSSDVKALTSKLSHSHISSLIAVWRQGSFRAAADYLDIAQASLQRPARILELLVGMPLYRRSASGLGVNENGAFLARRCALALGEIESGAQEIKSLVRQRASVRIGLLPLAPRMILAQAMQNFIPPAASAAIEIIDGAYDRLVNYLHDGEIDMIIGALRSPAPFPDLFEEAFFEDPYIIVGGPHHPLLKRDHLSCDDLLNYEWIYPTQGLPRRLVLDQWFQHKNSNQKGAFETSCLSTISTLLATSDRLSILSYWYARLDGASFVKHIKTEAIPHKTRYVGLTYRQNWLPTQFQADVMRHIRESAQMIKRTHHA